MSASPVPQDTGGVVYSVRWIAVALAYLFAIGAVIQIFLAGLSLFESAEYWVDHVDLGRMLALPAILLPIAAVLGRAGRQLTMMALAVTVLYVVQMVLATIDYGFIAAFHALNAFAVTGVAFQAGGRMLALVRARTRWSGTPGAALDANP